MLHVTKGFDLRLQASQDVIKDTVDYIYENELPTELIDDVDYCDNCGEIDHEFHDTTEMIGAGIGVICNSCLRDL
jgi:hypothetical protein